MFSWAYGFRGPSLRWWKNKGMAAETAESSYLDLQVGGRASILGMVRESLEPQTLPPRDTSPLSRLH